MLLNDIHNDVYLLAEQLHGPQDHWLKPYGYLFMGSSWSLLYSS